ncbi:MAG: DNA repair protein RecO [Planctomycetota bacterium]|jgi:DNA repair protein RecO (recombination protein O)
MLIKDIAICIRVSDYSETSQIATFFTKEHGKISAIAKGAKRAKSAFDGPIEVFSHGQVVYSEPVRENLATLTEFEQKRGFSVLARQLFCYHCGLFGAELVSSMTTDKDPHPELFKGFMEFLCHLEDVAQNDGGRSEGLLFLVLFQLQLLSQVGLQPILTACANCKNAYSEGWREVYFSPDGKGLVCRDCEGGFVDKFKLSKECAKSLSDMKLLADSEREVLAEIEKLLVLYFTDILGRRPLMARYVSS